MCRPHKRAFTARIRAAQLPVSVVGTRLMTPQVANAGEDTVTSLHVTHVHHLTCGYTQCAGYVHRLTCAQDTMYMYIIALMCTIHCTAYVQNLTCVQNTIYSTYPSSDLSEEPHCTDYVHHLPCVHNTIHSICTSSHMCTE